MANSVGLNAQSGCVQRVTIVGDETPKFEPQCFTDDSGTMFFGVWELDGDQIVLNFYTIDASGNLTPYSPTSAPVPCSPNDVESNGECWVAIADAAEYSVDDQLTQWFFWDVTTASPTLVGVAWYNNTTGQTLASAPLQADLMRCAPPIADKEAVCVYLGAGASVPAFRVCIGDTVSFITQDGDVTDQVTSWDAGPCPNDKTYVDTCFLPDQYAVQWAWDGGGNLLSYDPITQQWTDYGLTQWNGSTVGGYALAFDNNQSEPALYFQVNGNLYKADPNDPINSFSLIGPTLPDGPSSYPCFAFDPAGRLLLGIAAGSTVVEVDPTTGAATNIGALIDVRDGANLQAGPGDWFFDPSGRWFLMARDTRGATFGVCTGTVLWEIDPATLETTRISDSCSPVSGTGAEWLAAGLSLLSVGNGDIYQYNSYTDEWTLFDNTSPHNINDLSAQWIIPDPIRVFGWVDDGCEDPDLCSSCLYTLQQQPDFSFECIPFEIQLPGRLGICEPEPNPFVTDPATDTGGCNTCSDQVWHRGCSDAGSTLWRVSFDPAGNESIEYLYGNLTSPTTVQPPNFTRISCEDAVPPSETVTAFCNLDVVPNRTVYRREATDGTVTWFDATGVIPEPVDKVADPCDDDDPLLPIVEQIICLDGSPAVRERREIYIVNPEGLPELSQYQIIYFDENGLIWDSGLLNAADPLPPGEPTNWYFGDCIPQYIAFENQQLCELDDRKLLLIDSGGQFAEFSFFDDSLTPIAIPVPAAGTGADIENFILYAVTATSNLLVVDVQNRTVISQTPLFTNDGSPLSFSAAAFNQITGVFHTYDYGTNRLYQINTATAEVSQFQGPYTGINGTGASMAINPLTGQFYVSGTGGRVYEIDPTGGTLAATLVHTGTLTNCANGMTFDDQGLLYLGCTAGPNAVSSVDLTTGEEEVIVESWGPGVNSLAYYNITAGAPSCFNRRFGILPDGSREIIGDFNIATDAPRVVAGAIDCCECSCGGGSGGGDVCCTQPNLETEDFSLTNPDVLNIPANTAHSISIYVATGTADINGITFPAGAIRNVNSDDGQNNIGIAQDIDNITGNTLVTVTRYV